MHTDATLQLLEVETVELGAEFRSFIDAVCTEIQTKELAVEVAARQRREERKLLKEAKAVKKATKDQEQGTPAAKGDGAMDATETAALSSDVGSTTLPAKNSSSVAVDEPDGGKAEAPRKERKVKPLTAKLVTLNIRTPKFHFLGDYASTIRTFGTCDLFSTELVSPG